MPHHTRIPAPIAYQQGSILDGRYLSTEVGGGFTGRVIGMYVTEGSAAFDWFDYRSAAVDTH